MIKVSITLPNSAQIILEAEDPGTIRGVVAMVLRDMHRHETLVSSGSDAGTASPSCGVSVAASAPPGVPCAFQLDDGTSVPQPRERSPVSIDHLPGQKAGLRSDDSVAQPVTQADIVPKPVTRAEKKFIECCQSSNPMGDMRRVVVAADAASKLLNKSSVDTQELSRLFQLVGWQPPHNLVQTLRNAARSKFRWMERIPGRSGYYSATEVGRKIAAGS